MLGPAQPENAALKVKQAKISDIVERVKVIRLFELYVGHQVEVASGQTLQKSTLSIAGVFVLMPSLLDGQV